MVEMHRFMVRTRTLCMGIQLMAIENRRGLDEEGSKKE